MSYRNILGYNRQHPDFPITNEQLEAYVPKWLVYSLLWSFAGDAKLKVKTKFILYSTIYYIYYTLYKYIHIYSTVQYIELYSLINVFM